MNFPFSELARKIGIDLPLLTMITDEAATGEEKWGIAIVPIFFAFGIVLSIILWPPQISHSQPSQF